MSDHKKRLLEIIAKYNIKIDLEKLERERDKWKKPSLEESNKKRMQSKLRRIEREMEKEREAELKQIELNR